MVLESELNEKLIACRLQALRDALAAQPAAAIKFGNFGDGVRHKERAIQELIDANQPPVTPSALMTALETLHAANYVVDPDYTAIKNHITTKDHIVPEKHVLPPPVFEYAKISVLSYANGFTFWHYKCQAAAEITELFFDRAVDLLRVGDIILCSGPGGAKMVHVVDVDPPRIVDMI